MPQDNWLTELLQEMRSFIREAQLMHVEAAATATADAAVGSLDHQWTTLDTRERGRPALHLVSVGRAPERWH